MTAIEDCHDCGVWSYERPAGHSKSSAVRRGMAPMVTEWAFCLRGENGGSIWEVSHCVPGFATREEAIRAGTDAACAREARKRTAP